MIRRLSGSTEYRVDIGIVATTLESKERCELFIVKLAVAVSIILREDSFNFVRLEYTAESLESLLELFRLDSSKAIKVKMLENLLHSFTLIISTMGSLSDLFKNDVFKLCDFLGRHKVLVGVKSPSL